VQAHRRILPIGAQSSLTGGATPFGELLVSTGRMNRILRIDAQSATVEAGVPLSALEEAAHRVGATYPPRPTFAGAFAGGAVATNAAGAATFKYGSTREWVEALTVVLASGEVLEIARGECLADDDGFAIRNDAGVRRIPLPRYAMPDVVKRSAGYFAKPGMDLVDLFVGSEGTLGIITAVTFRLLFPAPALALALVMCRSEAEALRVAGDLRDRSLETWQTRDRNGIDVAAIEHVDARALALVDARSAPGAITLAIPQGTAVALLIQLELPPGTDARTAYEQVAAAGSPDAADAPLVRFANLIERYGLTDATELAAPGDDRRAAELLAFREAVPTAVNRLVGQAKRTIDARIEKTAADMVVPFDRFAEMMDVYRAGFASRGLDYAVWGHLSDGNVHPNVIPRSYDDVVQGKAAILQFGREVQRLGGCPLAEHGVGRNPVKQALLRQLYGDDGIEQMKAVKRALDPEWKLAPGVIFGEDP
jgi:D-lactate dehydrogenase (cytochrome)